MHSNTNYVFNGKAIKFWKGSDVPIEINDLFYIVRIETMFTIKEDYTPFVRYREQDLMRSPLFSELNNNRNLKERGWTILATSDIYSKRDNRYFSSYRDEKGNVVDATVILTLGKDDYLLFKEQYDIRYIKILDGCYFY